MIQRELAARLSIESPTLTRYLTAMEADGLIRRQPSATDRRAATVELTQAGRARYRKLAAIAVEGHAQLTRGFTDEEIVQLRDMLRRVQRNTGT
jgi:MarR family transcriptional regulator for hemolysin